MMICQNRIHDIFLSGDVSPDGGGVFVRPGVFTAPDFVMHCAEGLQNGFSALVPFSLRSTDARFIVSVTCGMFASHGNFSVNMDAAMKDMCLSVKFDVAAWADAHDRGVHTAALRRMREGFASAVSAPLAYGISSRRAHSRFQSGRMLKVQTGVFTL